MKETFIDGYINNNGWTPLFTAMFYNNLSTWHYFEKHTLNNDHVDYFGNKAKFYELKPRK